MPEQFDFIETRSLGLQLVRDLVEQLHGTFSVDDTGGTTCTLTFQAGRRARLAP
jgi:two-component sensor histidine kinase